MELRQIRYFIAIAEEEHFGRAAKRLRIAQPALSRQMQMLEAELGFDLFERLPRGVRLSPAGRVMLSEMKELELQLQRSIASARSVSTGQQGVLRLSLIESVAWHGLIPDTLRMFRELHPNVEVSLATMPTALQLFHLRQRNTEAALVYNPLNIEDLVAIHLADSPVILAMPLGCPLIEKEDIYLRDLKGYSMIGFQRAASPKFFDDLDNAVSTVDFSPNYVAEPTNETEILALVSTGAGLAFANAFQQWRQPHGVRFAPIRDLNVSQALNLVHRRNDISPTLAAFLAVLKDLVESSELPETNEA
ncbi:LysR substrate-binding domain-containing protein [Hoeflea alexandrii]|nr:LysR substrate-binding domain-containing protein [Hoeflea alexandrii]MCZ4290983.1 LysR substrate-binding domain-containing protein [Hoeflea alexandrii]